MAFGALMLVGAVDVELKAWLFGAGMFIVGAGFGLLASQLGNVNMSSVEADDTPEVGGLQGTYQNFGTSLGTALVGSVFILSLSTGFSAAISSSPDLPQKLKDQVSVQAEEGVPIVSNDQANQMLRKAGVQQKEANEIVQLYEDSQIESLKKALFFIFVAAILGLTLSRHMPNTAPSTS
jgi:hypothetical protein